MNFVYETILKFYQEIEKSPHHRYKSWEHCYQYFCSKDPDPNLASLHLAFYLASWGMYRGSSFLLDWDYAIHRPVVDRLLSSGKALQGIGVLKIEKEINTIFDLITWISKQYEEAPTTTLVTKILLGTLACVPAYDQYFIRGLRLSGLSYSGLKRSNFVKLLSFVKKPENLAQFETAQRQIEKVGGVGYPIMKLVDMYFWELGKPKKTFQLNARVSTENPKAIKSVLDEVLPKGSVTKTEEGFIIKAKMAGDSARGLNKTLLSALRRADTKTRLRSEWANGKSVEKFFD
jgi:hypothetical protein